MNRIYKVKKNAAGNSVACSEFAKGHTKKAVLGSLLIIGALGMASTANAQQTGNTINKATGNYSTVNGGAVNQATGSGSTVAGGVNNEATGEQSTISGGSTNRATAKNTTISGGEQNKTTNKHATVSGGTFNHAAGEYSTVGGGHQNQATNERSTVSGGIHNQATGNGSTVAGGQSNRAESTYSTVSGGLNNHAKGIQSTVAGGANNQATGTWSTIAGGSKNQAAGKGSFAAGVENQANTENAIAMGKKNIINGDNSAAIGSNNTVAEGQKDVFILGSNTSGVQSNSVLLGNNTSGKAATTVNNATVGNLNLTGFAGASKTENGVVSVGRVGGERQIVNVGAGEISANSTDAVNGSQLHALTTAVNEKLSGNINTKTVESLEKAVSQNQDDIAKNQAYILTNRVNIKELERKQENDIKDVVGIQNIIAEQADKNTADIAANKADADVSFETLTKNQNALIEQNKTINQELEGLAAHADVQDKQILQNQADITANKNAIEQNVNRTVANGFEIEKNKTTLAQHTKQINDNKQAIEAKLGGKVDTQKLDELKEDIQNNINNIYELAQQQDQHSSDIRNLSKASSANTDRIVKNKADIAKNNNDIQNLKTDTLGNRVSIQEFRQQHEKDIQQAVEMQNAIAEQADKNTADITTNTKRIATAELGITENKKDALIAKAQANENKDGIAKNKADIADNKADADAKFKGVQTDIANNKTTLAQHTKQINENKQAIEAKLGGKVDVQKLAELKTNVDKNKADADAKFTATEVAIAKNTQSITTLDSKVNTFDGRISALDAKVNGFDGRINALDDKFKNGMAAQAALNGLFQPYSVGKVSISAAIGGYGSKSAIAIGAGYRVNPQLAFKGGTAINVSGSKKSSYNVGVNYEF